MARIVITPDISIDESDIHESFILASGPGGQNVNKVASAVQLRFDTASLPDAMRAKLLRLAGRRATGGGEIVIVARATRSQERNRADARARLLALLRAAATPDMPRRRTRPPQASRRERLETKRARSTLKRQRARSYEE